MAHRYFTKDICDDTARLFGDDAAHLTKVLRAGPGRRVLLCDGAGTDYDAEITRAAPEEVCLRLLNSRPCLAEPLLHAAVYVGFSKGERMDWTVQKCVELGAFSIHPFISQNTVARPKNGEEKQKRLSRIAAEAAKQSGRGILPQVSLPFSFEDMLRGACAFGPALFFYEAGGLPLRAAIAGLTAPAGGSPRAGSVALITGPEGGFTPQEAEAARAAGCITVGLGPRILRCETAPAAALAVVMALSGNLETA